MARTHLAGELLPPETPGLGVPRAPTSLTPSHGPGRDELSGHPLPQAPRLQTRLRCPHETQISAPTPWESDHHLLTTNMATVAQPHPGPAPAPSFNAWNSLTPLAAPQKTPALPTLTPAAPTSAAPGQHAAPLPALLLPGGPGTATQGNSHGPDPHLGCSSQGSALGESRRAAVALAAGTQPGRALAAG